MTPAHAHLLSLAQCALTARDDRAAWKKNPENASAAHGAACDAVWKELEDQVAARGRRAGDGERVQRRGAAGGQRI